MLRLVGLQQGFATSEMGFSGQFARQESWATHGNSGSLATFAAIRRASSQ
jgi:hypothetical protein